MANEIHPTVILNGNVDLGNGNVILPYTTLTGPLKIGNNNLIGPLSVIGSPGQDTRNPRYESSHSVVEIGSNNIIREHVAIQKPCYRDATRVGNDTYIMHNVHVPHDALLEDNVVLAPGVVLAGLVCVLRGANIAIGCAVHQHGRGGDEGYQALLPLPSRTPTQREPLRHQEVRVLRQRGGD